ncbi:RagB/SusD family nutrient uptake outer membrane protein [Antarcticibacterium sp. 1MA-6-2]|uniref:RagB/SusD family nutrient uptake outer membrane protein n=1 Tax=Antarcticibacterium sp. 1MA-6-2 TaxID=2908210 RepID=UPI001F18AB8D|nr:RagB/SusD family nutrient uptake outer membrane protein [Antarcticibacterium sp. 1MA-6-2]UJH89800.1 RagB/SusD family nutrient uptake outer membrane protein [Antarcticibacterium sp. 1MA-6-2]
MVELSRFSPDFIPSEWVVEMYAEDDARREVYFETLPVTLGGLDYSDLVLVNKYPGNPELFTGANTNYQHAPKVFRIAEMYLISAEAAVRSTGDAAATLNSLRVARGLEALASVTLEDVKEERTRELAFEGFRLDDLKRWDEPMIRKDPQTLDAIQTGPGFHTLTKEEDAPKFIWGIPTHDITINRNLEQNPGW